MPFAKENYSEDNWGKVLKGLEKSRAIQAQKKLIRIAEYDKNPTKCNCCEKALPYKNRHDKYCNKSCSAIVNNVLHKKRTKEEALVIYKNKEEKSERYCVFCGKIIKGHKFCNNSCQVKWYWNKRKEYLKENGNWGSTCEISSNRMSKRYIIETRGHKCEVCNGIEWMGKSIPLVLDHIDGNSNNNDLSNLRLVCGNCDMQLPTYKSKNRGSGRAWRRERYKQGKSY